MQELLEGRLMGRMLLQRLAAGATGVKQARSVSIVKATACMLCAARLAYAHALNVYNNVPVCMTST